MIARRSGWIINLGSEAGKAGLAGSAVSLAARGGVNAFSKSLAREVGRHAVTVNVVCPEPTETLT
jgi:2-hydroxycyclohexanecarboxyl-CoA dehydrogenase